MALKNIRRVVKEKRRLANLEKSLGKDCQTQLKARAPANISERLSQVDVIFSALCGIDISTWPKQPPLYYHLYTRAFLKALKTWLFVWGRAEETTLVAWGQKAASAQVSLAVRSGFSKGFPCPGEKGMWAVTEQLCQRSRGVILKRQPERHLQSLSDF